MPSRWHICKRSTRRDPRLKPSPPTTKRTLVWGSVAWARLEELCGVLEKEFWEHLRSMLFQKDNFISLPQYEKKRRLNNLLFTIIMVEYATFLVFLISLSRKVRMIFLSGVSPQNWDVSFRLLFVISSITPSVCEVILWWSDSFQGSRKDRSLTEQKSQASPGYRQYTNKHMCGTSGSR
jgi:hypothetical protein